MQRLVGTLGIKMIVFGHRGAKGECPENTVASFRHAIDVGVNGIELDVQLSKDGKLVVIHDTDVDRTTNGNGKVSNYTSKELKLLDARADFPDCYKNVYIPRLKEVLDLIKEIPNIQIEIKCDAEDELKDICILLLKVIDEYKLGNNVVITSFIPEALEIIKSYNPDQNTGLISVTNDESFFEKARNIGCSDVCVCLRNGSYETVRNAHIFGFKVTGWLGNNYKDILTLLKWGVDSITTDYPSLALKIINSGC